MVKPILYLPKGSYDPNRFVKVNPYADPRETLAAIRTDPTMHREKADVVAGQVGGQPVFIVGSGEEYTEDLKDKFERYAEELTAEQAAREQFQAERAAIVQADWQKYFERKRELIRRNPVTYPNPDFNTRDQTKRIY